MEKRLKDHLEKYKIEYKSHAHPPVFTVEESKELKKNIPGLHTKSLFLKDENGKFYLISMKADKRLDIKSLRSTLNVRKLHFASPEELKAELKLTPGSVSVFGMIYASSNTKLILDEAVWNAKIVNFHPNINTATLELTHNEFKKFYDSIKKEKSVIQL